MEKSILSYYCSNFKSLIPYPTTITRLCILERVEGIWEKEERCPKTSPLTLTGIIKPPSNKGKEKVQEIEEETRNNRENKQAVMVSSIKKREQR